MLYSLLKSHEFSDDTLRSHLLKDLNKKPCILDTAVFYKHNNENLIEKCTSFVDDTLHVGNEEYFKRFKITEKKFQCKNLALDNNRLPRLHIEYTDDIRTVHWKQ